MFERFPFPSNLTDWAPGQRFNRTFIQQQQDKQEPR